MTHSFPYKSTLNSEGLAQKKKKMDNEFLIPESGPAGLVSNQSHTKENLLHRIQSILLEIYLIEKFITKT